MIEGLIYLQQEDRTNPLAVCQKCWEHGTKHIAICMSANEKFDTAMVFETQLDEVGMQSEQKKLSALLNRKMQAT